MPDPADLTTAYKDAFTSAAGTRDLDSTWAIMTYDGVADAEQSAQAAAGPRSAARYSSSASR